MIIVIIKMKIPKTTDFQTFFVLELFPVQENNSTISVKNKENNKFCFTY